MFRGDWRAAVVVVMRCMSCPGAIAPPPFVPRESPPHCSAQRCDRGFANCRQHFTQHDVNEDTLEKRVAGGGGGKYDKYNHSLAKKKGELERVETREFFLDVFALRFCARESAKRPTLILVALLRPFSPFAAQTKANLPETEAEHTE